MEVKTDESQPLNDAKSNIDVAAAVAASVAPTKVVRHRSAACCENHSCIAALLYTLLYGQNGRGNFSSSNFRGCVVLCSTWNTHHTTDLSRLAGTETVSPRREMMKT